MPDIYQITTDFSKNTLWTLRDEDRSSVRIAAVGTLAQLGSGMGYQVGIQKDAMNQLINEVEAVRDASRALSSQGFPELRTVNGVARPPEALDVANLMGRTTTSLLLNEVNRLAEFASWTKTTFAPWVGSGSPLLNFPDVKVTFRLDGSSNDSWLLLRDIYPLPLVPPDGVPQSSTGATLLNTPFSVEGDPSVYMMISIASGPAQRVKINSLQEVFSPNRTVAEYEDYFFRLAKARSDALLAKLPASSVASAPYDTITWRYDPLFSSDSRDNISQIVETKIVIQNTPIPFGPIPASAGSVIKCPSSTGTPEFVYFLVKNASPSKPSDLIPVIADASRQYIFSLSAEETQTVISQFGDQVVTLTQKSSQQSVYLNELMQKMALFLDAASNALKSLTDNENRIAAGI